MKKTRKCLVPLSKVKAKAQAKFNEYIRLRDYTKRCISCGVNPVEQAGHYYSRGLYTGLSFLEMNVHGQCCKCNMYLHGNLINYRKGLVVRYGADFVASLEDYAEKNRLHKWTRDDLENIYKKYTLKIKTFLSSDG